jgi:SpoVK/Ycf46/Vps4 family AAA+-type ATPase
LHKAVDETKAFFFAIDGLLNTLGG